MVRLLAASAAVGGTGTPITPGGISTSGITIPPMAGSPRACRRRCRNFSHTRNGQCPWNYWACWDCKSGGSTSPGLAPAQQFHHFRQSQCQSLWRSVRNSRTGRDQILPSDPNTVPVCGHRYQRCGNGCTEDIVTDRIPS